MLVRTGECHQCGECCRTVNMTVVRDVTLRQHGNREELERYLSYRCIGAMMLKSEYVKKA